MTNEIEKQEGEKLSHELISGAQDLVRRVSDHKEIDRFDDFIEELMSLRERLILGYDSMSFDQYQRTSFLINNAKQYLHEVYDVSRVRDMRKYVENPPRSKRNK